MAPPENPFPVHELPDRIRVKHILNDIRPEKSRKLPKDFNILRDCELYELVQYSCTTQEEFQESTMAGLRASNGENITPKQMECFPFVRLFRRCRYGNEEFNVETTAFEGRYAWKPSTRMLEEKERLLESQRNIEGEDDRSWTKYLSSFWK